MMNEKTCCNTLFESPCIQQSESKKVAKLFSHKKLTNTFVTFPDTPQTSEKGFKMIYEKTVLQISKIFWIMTMWDLSIQIF